MSAKDDFQRILDSLTEEIKEQIDNDISSIREVSTEQKMFPQRGREILNFIRSPKKRKRNS